MSSKQAVPALAATARPGPQRRPNSASPAVERSRDEHALAHRPAPRRFGPCSRGERRAMAPSTVPGPRDTTANISQDLDRRAARRRRDGYGDLGRRGDPRGVRRSAGPTARCSPPRGRRTARDGAVRSQPRRTRATARWSCSSPPAPGGPAEGESQPGDPGCPGRGACGRPRRGAISAVAAQSARRGGGCPPKMRVRRKLPNVAVGGYVCVVDRGESGDG